MKRGVGCALVAGLLFALGGVAGAKSSSTTTTQPILNIRGFKPGECVTWKERALAQQDARRVDCAQPHIMEMVGVSVPIPGRGYPSEQRWNELIRQLCTPGAEAYLHHPIDPNGRFGVGGIKPTGPTWVQGDHKVRCGLKAVLASATSPQEFVGRVDPNDQSFVFVTGTCLSRTATGGMTAGDCAAAHFAEVTGVVDLAGRFDHVPTNQETFDSVGAECRTAGEAYLGRGVDGALSVSFLPRSPESWNAGSSKVNCIITTFVDGQPVDLPGPLR